MKLSNANGFNNDNDNDNVNTTTAITTPSTITGNHITKLYKGNIEQYIYNNFNSNNNDDSYNNDKDI